MLIKYAPAYSRNRWFCYQDIYGLCFLNKNNYVQLKHLLFLCLLTLNLILNKCQKRTRIFEISGIFCPSTRIMCMTTLSCQSPGELSSSGEWLISRNSQQNLLALSRRLVWDEDHTCEHICGTEIRFFLMKKDQDNKRNISEKC